MMKISSERLHIAALNLVEHFGLLVISIATVLSMGDDVFDMVASRTVTLTDLLRLFLYLEVIAMVQRYYTQGEMPVRFPLYIAIVALARYIILEMKTMTEIRMLAVSFAIVLLALAILVIRYGHVKFPYVRKDKAPTEQEPQ